MIEALLARYGPLAIAIGAGLEGETVVLTGGALAGHGLFSPVTAFAAAFAGSALADQALFLAGRTGRSSRFVEKVRARPVFERVLGWIDRHPVPFILCFRFVYGARIAAPVALGTSGVRARLFVPLNLLAAAMWSALFTWLGWRFGTKLVPLVEQLFHRWRDAIGFGVVLLILVTVTIVLRRQSRQS